MHGTSYFEEFVWATIPVWVTDLHTPLIRALDVALGTMTLAQAFPQVPFGFLLQYVSPQNSAYFTQEFPSVSFPLHALQNTNPGTLLSASVYVRDLMNGGSTIQHEMEAFRVRRLTQTFVPLVGPVVMFVARYGMPRRPPPRLTQSEIRTRMAILNA